MKTIGVVTITNNGPNYGNSLQNYAVITVLKKMGFKAKTIFNNDGNHFSAISMLKNIYCFIFQPPKYPDRTRLIKTFFFRKQYLNCTAKVKKKSYMLRNNCFDYYVVGSDQVWNPYFKCNSIHLPYLFLQFTKPEKRIAYSASFGVDSIPEQYMHKFGMWLKEFKAISVREKKGLEILKEMGKDGELVIDPTMMLDADEWNRIAVKPKQVDCDCSYILTYFLGERTKKIDDYIKSISNGNCVYNLLDKAQPLVSKAGPREFLYLISHAQLICTDSFHACVFSFIYDLPFVVFERQGEKSMMSRMDTFLSTFGLNDRLYGDEFNNPYKCNYDQAKEILEEERKKAINFLRKSLDD